MMVIGLGVDDTAMSKFIDLVNHKKDQSLTHYLLTYNLHDISL